MIVFLSVSPDTPFLSRNPPNHVGCQVEIRQIKILQMSWCHEDISSDLLLKCSEMISVVSNASYDIYHTCYISSASRCINPTIRTYLRQTVGPEKEHVHARLSPCSKFPPLHKPSVIWLGLGGTYSFISPSSLLQLLERSDLPASK